MKGYVQVYTGDGKGKTTAALGLALRAAGAGLRVFIAQFAKGTHTSELDALARFADLVTVHRYGTGRFVRGTPTDEDLRVAREGLDEVRRILLAGQHDLVILDEANVATHLRLLPVDDMLTLIDSRPEHIELVLTGRNADPRVVEAADLVTEMHKVKHYFDAGVPARKGIET